MDKDLVLSLANEALKGKSPKRTLVELYPSRQETKLLETIKSFIRGGFDEDPIITFITNLTALIRDTSEVTTIMKDLIELDHLKKRLGSMLESYRRKGVILLLILYFVFPFITSALAAVSSLNLNLGGIGLTKIHGDTGEINTLDLVIYSLYIEVLPTIFISRLFQLDTRKMLMIQLLLYMLIYTFTSSWFNQLLPLGV